MKPSLIVPVIVTAVLLSSLSSGHAQEQRGRLLEMLFRGLAGAVVSDNGSQLDLRGRHSVPSRSVQSRSVSPPVQSSRPVVRAHPPLLNRFQNQPVVRSAQPSYSTTPPRVNTPGIQAHNYLTERFSANTNLKPQILTGPYYDPPIGGVSAHSRPSHHSRSSYHSRHGSHSQSYSRHGGHHSQAAPPMKLTPILPPLFNQNRPHGGHGDHRGHGHQNSNHSNHSSAQPRVIGVNSPFGGIFSGPFQGRSSTSGVVRQQGRVMLYRVR